MKATCKNLYEMYFEYVNKTGVYPNRLECTIQIDCGNKYEYENVIIGIEPYSDECDKEEYDHIYWFCGDFEGMCRLVFDNDDTDFTLWDIRKMWHEEV